ncbi:hypothetical protein [Bifidobacterium psychraerophilum]|jgi:hypothetical protein|nr:hypothetical protein [Bifidobacterium psychraerophilum]
MIGTAQGKEATMQFLNDSQGHELTGTNGFDEPITYTVCRFQADRSLALMTVCRDEKGNMGADPVSVNLMAYGYIPMRGHTYINEEYLELVQPLIDAEQARICGHIHYGPYNASALDMEILIDNIEEIADQNSQEE